MLGSSNRKEQLNNFAENLSELIRRKGYSQEEFARAAGLSQGTVSKYINKQQLPGLEAIISMSQVLDMSVDEMMKLKNRK